MDARPRFACAVMFTCVCLFRSVYAFVWNCISLEMILLLQLYSKATLSAQQKGQILRRGVGRLQIPNNPWSGKYAEASNHLVYFSSVLFSASPSRLAAIAYTRRSSHPVRADGTRPEIPVHHTHAHTSEAESQWPLSQLTNDGDLRHLLETSKTGVSPRLHLSTSHTPESHAYRPRWPNRLILITIMTLWILLEQGPTPEGCAHT